MLGLDKKKQEPGPENRLLILLIIFVISIAPLIFYWLVFGQIENITPEQAKILLSAQGDPTLLIDINAADSFVEKHVDGAQNWPLSEIMDLNSPENAPPHFKNKTLLVICNTGGDSTKAVVHLNNLGVSNVKNVRGGISDWIGSVAGPEGEMYDRWATASGEIIHFPSRILSWLMQLIVVVSGFGFKGCYTFLSFVLIILLWKNQTVDLAALRWGMIFFFVGENFCLANYIIFFEKSYIFEYFHNLGMLLSFGFVTYAVIEGLDRRLLFLSDSSRKCASLSLCQECIKYKDVPCRLKHMFYLALPACIALCFIPLCALGHSMSYNVDIFGTYYNYSHSLMYQLFELRFCPIAALVLLTISLAILLLDKKNPLPRSKIFFAAGMGVLGFGTFRMILIGVFKDNLWWYGFWEETTELIFIVSICVVLWIFRNSLLRKTAS